MNKIYIYSDLYLPTFPYLELPLYNYLEEQGINVQYVLHKNDIRLTTKELSDRFTNLNLMTISKNKDIVKCMNTSDMLVSRFAYKGDCGRTAEHVRAAGHKILMYDPSGIDIRVRACPAQYLTAKSEYLKVKTLKKFPKQYKKIFASGTIHYDSAAITTVDRDSFMESYGLDTTKKLAILTPANPGEKGQQKGIEDEYKQIINIIKTKCPNYEIMVKAHPLDYTASMPSQPGIIHKNEHYGGKHSWEKFAPGGVKVVKAEEGYKSLKACDVILNVRSSIAMETALFRKPLININRSKYTTNWPFASGVMMDIKLDELALTLNSDNYSISEYECKQYCIDQCFSDDGKSYKRTADIIIKIFSGQI